MWVWEPLLITSGELSRARTCYRGRAPVVGNSHVLAVISDQETEGAGAECTIWTWSRIGEQTHTVFTTVTNRGPVWVRGCLVSHIVNINITHESGPRPQQERTLPVCEQGTLWTLSAGPASNNDNGQLFLSSSHELLVTEIEHGLICATEIETYCALLRMRMFTDT